MMSNGASGPSGQVARASPSSGNGSSPMPAKHSVNVVTTAFGRIHEQLAQVTKQNERLEQTLAIERKRREALETRIDLLASKLEQSEAAKVSGSGAGVSSSNVETEQTQADIQELKLRVESLERACIDLFADANVILENDYKPSSANEEPAEQGSQPQSHLQSHTNRSNGGPNTAESDHSSQRGMPSEVAYSGSRRSSHTTYGPLGTDYATSASAGQKRKAVQFALDAPPSSKQRQQTSLLDQIAQISPRGDDPVFSKISLKRTERYISNQMTLKVLLGSSKLSRLPPLYVKVIEQDEDDRSTYSKISEKMFEIICGLDKQCGLNMLVYYTPANIPQRCRLECHFTGVAAPSVEEAFFSDRGTDDIRHVNFDIVPNSRCLSGIELALNSEDNLKATVSKDLLGHKLMQLIGPQGQSSHWIPFLEDRSGRSPSEPYNSTATETSHDETTTTYPDASTSHHNHYGISAQASVEAYDPTVYGRLPSYIQDGSS